MNRFFRSALFPLIVIVLLVYLASQTLMGNSKNERKVTYSQLQDRVADQPETIEKIVIDPNKQRASTELKDGEKFNVNYPSDQSLLTLESQLKEQNVTYDSKGRGSSPWWNLLISLLPFVLLFGFWIFLMNQVQGGGSKVMSFGKSPREADDAGLAEDRLQGRGRCGRGRGGAPGDQGVPREPQEVPGARGPHPEGRAAVRPARNR